MTTATDPTSTSSANSVLQTYLTQQAQNVAADKASAAAAAASGSSATTNSAAQLGTNFNTFIKILTTQLQHQDPASATDPNQFTQELVQFAGVEQQLNTNSKLDSLLGLQKSSTGTAAALGYMGQYVEASANGKLALQNGKTEIGYNLPSTAKSSYVTVKDSSGNTVASLAGPTAAGLNYISWDGKDSNGNQLPDGAYSFSVVANDASTGAAESITDTRVIGKVTAITSNTDGSINLSLGSGISIGTSAVDSVYSAGNLPDATAAA